MSSDGWLGPYGFYGSVKQRPPFRSSTLTRMPQWSVGNLHITHFMVVTIPLFLWPIAYRYSVYGSETSDPGIRGPSTT